MALDLCKYHMSITMNGNAVLNARLTGAMAYDILNEFSKAYQPIDRKVVVTSMSLLQHIIDMKRGDRAITKEYKAIGFDIMVHIAKHRD